MDKKPLPDDFREFVQCLNKHEVRYLLVGGWAVGIYGNPRATKDIDFLIAVDADNIRQLQRALFDFGAPTVANEVFQTSIGSEALPFKSTSSIRHPGSISTNVTQGETY